MPKRTGLNDREKRPLDALFTKENNASTKKQSKKISEKNYVRKTYHVTQDIVDTLALYSAFEKVDKSEVVRKALEKHIPQKYFQMPKLNDEK